MPRHLVVVAGLCALLVLGASCGKSKKDDSASGTSDSAAATTVASTSLPPSSSPSSDEAPRDSEAPTSSGLPEGSTPASVPTPPTTRAPSEMIAAGSPAATDDFRVPGPAPTVSPGVPGSVAFVSPSGNISCFGFTAPPESAASVRCEVAGATFPEAPRSADCHEPDPWQPRVLILNESGPSLGVCSGQAAVLGSGPTLSYGSTLRFGEIACRMDEVGLMCENGDHKGWFVSQSEYRTFG